MKTLKIDNRYGINYAKPDRKYESRSPKQIRKYQLRKRIEEIQEIQRLNKEINSLLY